MRNGNLEKIRKKWQQRADSAVEERYNRDYGTRTSGNWGHKGRPGEVGGSLPGGGHNWLIENRDTFVTNDGNKHATRWLKTGKKVAVRGPSETRDYLNGREFNPDHVRMARKVLGDLKNFDRRYPDLKDDTFDARTLKPVHLTRGFCVTFHQNNTADDYFGGYDNDTYAKMCADAMANLKTDKIYYGNYGNPEVSFVAEDIDDAMNYAVMHNQESIYDAKIGDIDINPFYKSEYNPIRKK